MLLVYFDNAQLAVLAAARRKNPREYEAFLHRWGEIGGEVAISWLHLHEIRRFENAEGRADRYAVLNDLAPVRIDFPVGPDVPASLSQLTNREAMTALSRKGWISTDDDFIKVNGRAFPTVLATEAELAGLQIYEGAEFHALAEAFYAAAELGARAKSRPTGTEYHNPKLGSLPDVTPTPEQIAAFETELREGLDHELKFDQLRGVMTDEDIAAAKEHVLAAMNAFMADAAESGIRKALAAAYSAGNESDAAKVPVKNLRHAHLFRSEVRDGLIELMPGADSTVVEELVSAISIEDCPGCWLRAAVADQVQRSFPQDHASNLFDINHIGYLPHVDILFCDKRIGEITRQVMRRAKLPDRLKGVSAPVSVRNTVEAIVEALNTAAHNKQRNHGA